MYTGELWPFCLGWLLQGWLLQLTHLLTFSYRKISNGCLIREETRAANMVQWWVNI